MSDSDSSTSSETSPTTRRWNKIEHAVQEQKAMTPQERRQKLRQMIMIKQTRRLNRSAQEHKLEDMRQKMREEMEAEIKKNKNDDELSDTDDENDEEFSLKGSQSKEDKKREKLREKRRLKKKKQKAKKLEAMKDKNKSEETIVTTDDNKK